MPRSRIAVYSFSNQFLQKNPHLQPHSQQEHVDLIVNKYIQQKNTKDDGDSAVDLDDWTIKILGFLIF